VVRKKKLAPLKQNTIWIGHCTFHLISPKSSESVFWYREKGCSFYM